MEKARSEEQADDSRMIALDLAVGVLICCANHIRKEKIWLRRWWLWVFPLRRSWWFVSPSWCGGRGHGYGPGRDRGHDRGALRDACYSDGSRAS